MLAALSIYLSGSHIINISSLCKFVNMYFSYLLWVGRGWCSIIIVFYYISMKVRGVTLKWSNANTWCILMQLHEVFVWLWNLYWKGSPTWSYFKVFFKSLQHCLVIVRVLFSWCLPQGKDSLCIRLVFNIPLIVTLLSSQHTSFNMRFNPLATEVITKRVCSICRPYFLAILSLSRFLLQIERFPSNAWGCGTGLVHISSSNLVRCYLLCHSCHDLFTISMDL